MKQIILTMLAVVFFATTAFSGEPFPDLTLKGLSDADKATLGVSGDAPQLSEIKGSYLFIEAYSMYCPICQRDAPHVASVYDTLKKHEKTLKFIGIGLGNTEFEVEFYRKKFNVHYPLVPDETYVIHKALGEVPTPTFYVIKLGPNPELLFVQKGEAKTDEALLKIISETTGIK